MTIMTPGDTTPAVQDQMLTVPPRPVERRNNDPTPPAAPGQNAQAAKSDQAIQETNGRPLEFDVGEELKLQVRFDEAAGRFVYMGVNTESGEIERQYPAEEALQMIARMHDMLGQRLDQKL